MNKNFGIIYHKKRTKKLSNFKLYQACYTIDEAMSLVITDQRIKELSRKNNFYIIEIQEENEWEL